MSQSAAAIYSKCHPVVLALLLCTTERFTYFQSTSITSFMSELSNAAVNDEWDLQRVAFLTAHHGSVSSHRLCA